VQDLRSEVLEKKALLALLVALAVALLSPAGAGAYFERLALSSRVGAMGGAFVSVADDVTAVVLNPAGLAQLRSPAVISTVTEPYGITDLREYFVGAALPGRLASVGVSWHHFGLDGVTSEDLFTISAGKDIVRTSQDASLSVGGGVDIARVAYSDPLDASATFVTGSLSVLLRPFPFVGAGYAVRNIGEPSLDFGSPSWPGMGGVETGATRLAATHTFGFAYHRDGMFSVLYERERAQDGRWRDRFGIEVTAGDHLRIRSGLSGRDVAGGVGATWSNVTIDVGVTSHGALGLSYVVSAGIALPAGGEGEGE
jgi:hypothetical protein